MALGKNGGGVSTGVALVLLVAAGLAGTAASLYAMVVAYLAGSSAQAAIDGTSPADPQSLAVASMAELGAQAAAKNEEPSVIEIDESAVIIADHNPQGGAA